MPKNVILPNKRTRLKNVQVGKIKSGLDLLTPSWKL